MIARPLEGHAFVLPGGAPTPPSTCYEQGVEVGKAWCKATDSLLKLRQRQREGMGPRESKEILGEFEEDLSILRKLIEGVGPECDVNAMRRIDAVREINEALGFASEGKYISAEDALENVV